MTASSKYYLPAIVWLLFITGMSLVPKMQLPKFDLISVDKAGHLASYAVLVWLLLYGYRRREGAPATPRTGWVFVAAATAYGALLEFVQGNFIPGRFFGYDDMIANALGALGAWLLYRYLRP
jgi:VanZ family protein